MRNVLRITIALAVLTVGCGESKTAADGKASDCRANVAAEAQRPFTSANLSPARKAVAERVAAAFVAGRESDGVYSRIVSIDGTTLKLETARFAIGSACTRVIYETCSLEIGPNAKARRGEKTVAVETQGDTIEHLQRATTDVRKEPTDRQKKTSYCPLSASTSEAQADAVVASLNELFASQ